MTLIDLTSGGSPTYVLGAHDPIFKQPVTSHEADDGATSTLRRRLEQASELQVVGFYPSVAAAQESALVAARRLTGRPGVVTCRGAAPEEGARLVSHGDGLQVERAFAQDKPAALLIEVVQASAGACVPPPKYFDRVRAACDDAGVKLVVDETAGLGRTGALFAFEREDLRPDLVVLSLAVAPGIDDAALLARPELGLETEVRGCPAARAVLGVLDVIERDRLSEGAKKLGRLLQKLIHQILETRREWAMDTRGRGLLHSLTLWDNPGIVVAAAARRDLATTGSNGLLFAPPLTSTAADLSETFAVLDQVFVGL